MSMLLQWVVMFLALAMDVAAYAKQLTGKGIKAAEQEQQERAEAEEAKRSC